jgi:hypothetical protein
VFLVTLKTLAPEELRLCLQLLALALAVDGKVTSRESTLWKDALAGAGRPVDSTSLEALRRAFAAGDPDLVQRLREV